MQKLCLVLDSQNVIYLKLLFFVVHIDLILSFPTSKEKQA